MQIVPKFTIKKKRKIASSSSSSQVLDKQHKRTVVDNDVAKTTTDNLFANECGTAKGNAPSCSVTTEGKNNTVPMTTRHQVAVRRRRQLEHKISRALTIMNNEGRY